MKPQIRVLKTESDYDVAIARLSALMDKDLKPGSSEEAELELLTLVIQSYEQTLVPPSSVDPIEAILFRMDQQKLAQKDLIPFIGSLSKVSEVLGRKRTLSLSMIRRLHKGLGIPADVLISENLAEGIDFSTDPATDYSKFPLMEMQDRGLFGAVKRSAQQLKDYAEELVTGLFRGVSGLDGQPLKLRAALHQSGARSMDEFALLTWQLCVLRKARSQPLKGKYQTGSITTAWLRDLAKLSSFDTGPQLAQEYLSNYGIALVFERHFDKTYLDGAAMLDGEVPVIGLTLRHDRLDNFWFALLHELIHVQKHLSQENLCIADNLDDKSRSTIEEQEADREAGEALIPMDVWNTSSVSTTYSLEDALLLARQLQIHPAIIAGRVRKETDNWRLLSGLISSSGKVSELFPSQLTY
jgi:HTH-type transcriptional regulator/antitoxin HigA